MTTIVHDTLQLGHVYVGLNRVDEVVLATTKLSKAHRWLEEARWAYSLEVWRDDEKVGHFYVDRQHPHGPFVWTPNAAYEPIT